MIHFRSIVLIGLLTVLNTSAAPFNSATYDGGPKTAENHLIKLRYAMDKASSKRPCWMKWEPMVLFKP